MMAIKKKTVDLNYIKQLRKDNNYSNSELAKMLGFKSVDKYTRRENGVYHFQASELQMLSELYGVDMENFFTLSV